jgi:methionyl-tRNA synthetase
MINIDEFAKVQLRVARVESAGRAPGSKKLLQLTVQVGEELRTVVAGIGKQYAPEELVGKTVIVVANLEPATLAGVTSNGMVLAASWGEGAGQELSLLTLDRPLPPGAKVS